jgi:hypothetical protein
MLSLNSQILADGYYSLSCSVARGKIHTEAYLQTGSAIGPEALARTLAQVDELSNVLLRTEDTPTAHARDSVKRMLSAAQTYGPIYLGANTVEGFEGDLLIHWDTLTRSVVLISPAIATKASQVYTETLSGNHPVRSALLKNASPFDLWKSLKWLLNG